MFRVVPDQLKISDGWVRCGHCSDVFDAMLNLQSETPSAEASPPSPPPPSPPPTEAPSASRVVFRRVPVSPATPPLEPPPAVAPPPPYTPVFEQRTAPVPSPVSAAPSVASFSAAPSAPSAASSPVDPGWGFASQFEEPEEGPESESDADDTWDGDWLLSPQVVSQHRDAVQKELQSQAVAGSAGGGVPKVTSEDFERELAQFGASGRRGEEVELAVAPPPPVAQPSLPPPAWDSGFEAEEPVPAFVVQGRRDAFWRTPAMRAGLMALAALLGGLLALQWAVHERDQLAARYPALEPALQTICQVAGCRLAAPRHIEAVAIDSSTLTRKLGQFYSFDLVVKNSEPMAVAMPALELSLTDGRDKEIARRVFLPEEMPGTPTVVPAQGSLAVSMRLALSESELSTMAGYRALVFYP